MSLEHLVRRAMQMNQLAGPAGTGGGRGDSNVSTHAVANNPLTEITTAAESRPDRDWEWI